VWRNDTSIPFSLSDIIDLMTKPSESLPIIDEQKIGAHLKFHGLSGPEIDAELVDIEKSGGLPAEILRWWRGDAHTHSAESTREGFNYPEGLYHYEEILYYYEMLGLDFVCFTEHASLPQSPCVQEPTSAISQSLLEHTKRIHNLRKELSGKYRCLPFAGVEANIMYEGEKPRIDIPDEVLAELDFVIASRHRVPEEKRTELGDIRESLSSAIVNPYVNVIGHPDRDIQTKTEDPRAAEAYWQMWKELLGEMRLKNKAFEINLKAQPDPKLVQMAADMGVKFFLNFDAHEFNQFLNYGDPSSITTEQRKADAQKYAWAAGSADEDDLLGLAIYKKEKLAQGPGVVPILRLAHWIKYLEEIGVQPEQVVNSSRENFLAFLHGNSETQTA